MVQQIIKFDAQSLVDIGSGTITAKLLDGVPTALSGIAEGTNKGEYTGTVDDIAAGDYKLQIFWEGQLIANRWVRLVLAVGTYQALTLEAFNQVDGNDRLGFTLAALAGNCSDAGTAAETYAITIGADTFTIDHTGLDATGNRSTATLTKS